MSTSPYRDLCTLIQLPADHGWGQAPALQHASSLSLDSGFRRSDDFGGIHTAGRRRVPGGLTSTTQTKILHYGNGNVTIVV